jgi:hypothetical protein
LKSIFKVYFLKFQCYSRLILIKRLDNELQGNVLLGDMEDCRFALYNLVIAGIGTPFLHNGTIHYDDHGNALEKPKHGLQTRNQIGLLYWNSKEEDNNRTEVI